MYLLNILNILCKIIFSNSNVVILPPGLQLSYNHQQMTIPQQPTVKILKRPQTNNTENENADKPKVQVKSLEQVCSILCVTKLLEVKLYILNCLIFIDVYLEKTRICRSSIKNYGRRARRIIAC